MENKILGPVLIPNKKIYRNKNKIIDVPHYVSFTVETISKLRTKFHRDRNDDKVNLNHDGVLIGGVKMIKSFLIDETNKNVLPKEFGNLPLGTWMVEYVVEDEDVWKKIKNKELNGFSIEGVFSYNI